MNKSDMNIKQSKIARPTRYRPNHIIFGQQKESNAMTFSCHTSGGVQPILRLTLLAWGRCNNSQHKKDKKVRGI